MVNLLVCETLAFAIHGNIKKSYKNYKFNISAPTWNEEFELPHGLYSVSNYWETILSVSSEIMRQFLTIFQ